MKKLIALLLALVMVFSLAACSSTDASPSGESAEPAVSPQEQTPAESADSSDSAALPYEGVELTIGLAPLKSADMDKAFWDEQLKEFTAQTGATVTVEVNGWSDLQSKYLTSFMSDSPYDVLYGWPGLLVDYVASDFMIDLSPYYTEEEIANEYFWEAGRYSDGGVYCVAFAGGSAYRAYCFNLDILNECGITELPETWDELLEVCRIVHEKRPDIYTCLTPMTGTTQALDATIQPLVLQAGGDYWANGDYSRLAINTPERTKAFEMLLTMVDEGYISQDALGMDRDVVDSLFIDGKVAITVTDGAQNKFPDSVSFDWVASTAMHDAAALSCNPVDCLGVSAACENKEAAVALIKFMNSTDVRAAFNAEIYQSAQLRATDIPTEFPAEMEDVFAHPERSWSPAMVPLPGTFYDVYISTMQKIVSGDVTIEEGLNAFQAEMDALMEE